jgi:methionyl-tRNA formyltransferase
MPTHFYYHQPLGKKNYFQLRLQKGSLILLSQTHISFGVLRAKDKKVSLSQNYNVKSKIIALIQLNNFLFINYAKILQYSTIMKVVFMGTPEFAVTILDAINKSHHEIVGVVTAPDRPAGRGRKIKFSAVKEYALEQELQILQPAKLRDPNFISTLSSFNADIFIVVAFRMLPELVWSIPEKGTVNLHASLLPDYRGAAPINWAIINGEKTTGATTFFINDKIDTGDILLQANCSIDENMTAGQLHDKLMVLGADLIIETVNQIEKDALTPEPQSNPTVIKKAPKIFREDCKINWELDTHSIHNHIRGMSPYPGAWTEVLYRNDSKTLKIIQAEITDLESNNEYIGLQFNKSQILLHTKDGVLNIKILQLEGKKKMTAQEFLNGMDMNQLVLKSS